MRSRRHVRKTSVVLVAAVGSLLLPSNGAEAATASGVESAFVSILNQQRANLGKPKLVVHAGLRTIARNWSSTMASTNQFKHGDFSGRVKSASPDPAEGNGPPDDGFTAWCENIAWNSLAQGATDQQVAQKFYDQWFASTSGHKECMLSQSPANFGQNVIGFGVYYDSPDGRWYATADIVKDNTPPSWVRAQQTSGAIVYSGSWSADISSSKSSGGSYRRSKATGAYASYTCTCTGVRWIGHRFPSAGIAEIRVDGVLKKTLDTYAATSAYQRALYTRTGLTPGTHTLEIRVKGTKNPDSTSYYINVDAFERLP